MPGPSQRGLNLKLTIWCTEQRSKVIAHVKLSTREQIKQETISKINLAKHNNNQKRLNDTVCKDYSELESLKIGNQLLKQLNNELQDKNRILNELLNKEIICKNL